MTRVPSSSSSIPDSRGAPLGGATGPPFFSVLIPTHQRRDSLQEALRALARVAYPHDRMELVLVCDGCTDGSASMVRSLRLPFSTAVLEQGPPNLGPAAARNLAVARARGPFILFLDDDVLASPGLLSEHARAHLEAPDEQRVVIGTLMPPPERRSPWVQWELDTVVRQYGQMEAGEYRPGPRQFYTGNASIRLEQVRAAGGFDTEFRRGEDVELAFRLQARGLRFVFRRRAAAVHMADRSFASWFRAAYHYGRNDVVLGLRRGRPDMLKAIGHEFWERNPLNRWLVRAMLRAPGCERAAAPAAVAAAWAATRLGRRRLSRSVCSALFTLAYWHGVSDELAGPAAARQLIELGARWSEVDWAAVPERFRPSHGNAT
jgi:GT2 family glycosyltransferase